MGTRNLTCVYLDGRYRVAQYGQWDGYPEGQGITCLDFANCMKGIVFNETFKKQLRKIDFAPEGYVSGLWAAFASEKGHISYASEEKLKRRFPEFHRDTAADILEMILLGHVGDYLENSIQFAADSLFCEWAYVIDLDVGTFEVYRGFNHEPLTQDDRFFFLDGNRDYHPVKLVKAWSIDDLPDHEKFIKEIDEIIKEEEEQHDP